MLEEFVDAYKEQAAEERWSSPEIRMEESSHSASFLYIAFDPAPEDSSHFSYRSEKRSTYNLKHSLHVHITGTRETGDRFRPTEQIGEVMSAKLDDKKVAINMRIRSKWERLLASLYFGNTLLVIDCDAEDFTYGFDD